MISMQYRLLSGVYAKLEQTSKRLEKTNILANFLQEVPGEELEHVMLLVQGRVFPQWDSRELGMSNRLLLKAISLATGKSHDEVEIEISIFADKYFRGLSLFFRRRT